MSKLASRRCPAFHAHFGQHLPRLTRLPNRRFISNNEGCYLSPLFFLQCMIMMHYKANGRCHSAVIDAEAVKHLRNSHRRILKHTRQCRGL